MRTRTRRRSGWAGAGALVLLVGAPELAHAQQSGLFPLMPIRRERTPCVIEDPVYKLYRQEYFGYHPTCWRRFPAGWGCPSPEAPNAAASFREMPLDKPATDAGAGPEGGMGAPDGQPAPGETRPTPGGAGSPTQRNPLPPLPSESERSPFDLDTRPSTPPGGNQPGGPRTPPPPDSPGLGAQEQPIRVIEPEAPSSPPAASVNPRGEEPFLALPDPTVGRDLPAPSPTQVPGAETSSSPVVGNSASAGPAQAPRRPSLIGTFFSSLRRR